jgi:hypothetical protein
VVVTLMGNACRFSAQLFKVCRQEQTFLVEILPGGRQRKFSISSFQQGYTKALLQHLNLLGDGGLGDVTFSGGLSKAAAADNSLKIFKLSEHIRPLLLFY